MPSQPKFHLRTEGCVCAFCGATEETSPERTFVSDQYEHRDVCNSCIDMMQFLVNNADRMDRDHVDPEKLVHSTQADMRAIKSGGDLSGR